MLRIGLTDFDQYWSYSASAGEHTDQTTEINDDTVADVNVFSSTCVNVGDVAYFGHTYNRFGRISACVSSVINGAPGISWQYHNGNTWVDIPELENEFDFTTAGSQDLIMTGSEYDLWRQSWQKTTVCAVEAYYIRASVDSVVGVSGSGATLTSGSADLTFENPLPRMGFDQFARLHQAMLGNRTLDINATKRRVEFTWTAIDKDDVNSLRERAAMTKSTCIVFPADWEEDENPISVIQDPEQSYVDRYGEPALHTVTLTFLQK